MIPKRSIKSLIWWSFILAITLLTCPVQSLSEERKIQPLSGGNIDWIVPHAPGGGFDTYSRALAPYLRKYLPGRPNILVRNVPEAGSRIGAKLMFDAKPDGRTIGIWDIPGLTFGQLVEKGEYDLRKITWLGSFGEAANIIVAGGNTGLKTIEDMKKAKQIVVATHGYANPNFFTALLVHNNLGINAKYITGLKGTSDLALSVMRGEAQVFYVDPTGVMNYIKQGDLVPIVTFAKKRSAGLPAVPTIAEAGYPKLTDSSALNRLIGGPPGIPGEIKSVLVEALDKALHDAEFQKWSKESDRPVDPASPEEAADIAKRSFEQINLIKDDVVKLMGRK